MVGLLAVKTQAVVVVCGVTSCLMSTLYLLPTAQKGTIEKMQLKNRVIDYLASKIGYDVILSKTPSNGEMNIPLSGDVSSFTSEPIWTSVFYSHTIENSIKGNTKRNYVRVWNPSDYCEDRRCTKVKSNRMMKTVKESTSLSMTASISNKQHQQKQAQLHNNPASYTGQIATSDFSVNSHGCSPASKWHLYVPTTCNILHEIDFRNKLETPSSRSTKENSETESPMINLLSSGGARDAWLLETNDTPESTDDLRSAVVMKTSRWKRDFSETRHGHQLKDALATERLTSSPYVVDIYGYCGFSVINEYADGGDLYHWAKRNETDTTTTTTTASIEKLIFARDAALGLADIHGIDDEDGTTMLHHDVRANNFLIIDGKLKFHDFNQAKFSRWNRKKDKTCGFSLKGLCSEKNVHKVAPEECLNPKEITEKLEIYRFGVFLFHLLAGEYPYYFEPGEENQSSSQVLRWVLDKKKDPTFPTDVQDSDVPAIIVLMKATRHAMAYDDRKRPTAKSLAERLVVATEKVTKYAGFSDNETL